MKGLGLRGRKPRAFVRTTESVPGAEAAPDLIRRDFTADAPNTKWVGDVTYRRTSLFPSRGRVVGWAVSPTNDRKLALSALHAALVSRQPAPGWIHHTVRSSPFLSDDYQKALEAAHARPSNSRSGNCYDNAAMERWNATLKRGRRRRRKRAELACGETRRQGARRTRPGGGARRQAEREPPRRGVRQPRTHGAQRLPIHRDVLQHDTAPLGKLQPQSRRVRAGGRRVSVRF